MEVEVGAAAAAAAAAAATVTGAETGTGGSVFFSTSAVSASILFQGPVFFSSSPPVSSP